MDETSKDNDITEQTWNKLEKTSKKRGLREGISDGRDSNFQKSFDIGYEQGFRNGYMLGKYKGITAAQSSQQGQQKNHPLLENTMRGDCVVCKDSGILEKDMNEIMDLQTKAYLINEELLKTYLKESFNDVKVQ